MGSGWDSEALWPVHFTSTPEGLPEELPRLFEDVRTSPGLPLFCTPPPVAKTTLQQMQPGMMLVASSLRKSTHGLSVAQWHLSKRWLQWGQPLEKGDLLGGSLLHDSSPDSHAGLLCKQGTGPAGWLCTQNGCSLGDGMSKPPSQLDVCYMLFCKENGHFERDVAVALPNTGKHRSSETLLVNNISFLFNLLYSEPLKRTLC